MKLKFNFSKIEFDRDNSCINVSCHVIDEGDYDPSTDKSLFCEIDVTMPHIDTGVLSSDIIKQHTKEILKEHLIKVIEQL